MPASTDLANDLHQAVEHYRNRLHQEIDALIASHLTPAALALELADRIAGPPPAPPQPPAEPTVGGS